MKLLRTLSIAHSSSSYRWYWFYTRSIKSSSWKTSFKLLVLTS